MRPCGDCKRHVRVSALVCPFCAVAIAVLGCHRGPTVTNDPDASTRLTENTQGSRGPVYGGPPVDLRATQLERQLEALAEAGAASAQPSDAGGAGLRLRGEASVSLTVEGPTTGSDERFVAAMRPGFATCARNAVLADASIAASPTLILSIASNGDVTSATLANAGDLSPLEGDCLTRKAKRVAFDEGSPRTLRITIKQSLAK